MPTGLLIRLIIDRSPLADSLRGECSRDIMLLHQYARAMEGGVIMGGY